jgi:hypothetical protein
MTVKNKRILVEIRKKRCQGKVEVRLPGTAGAAYRSEAMQVISVKEEKPPRPRGMSRWNGCGNFVSDGDKRTGNR